MVSVGTAGRLVIAQSELLEQGLLARVDAWVEALPSFAWQVNEIALGFEKQLTLVFGQRGIQEFGLETHVKPILSLVGIDCEGVASDWLAIHKGIELIVGDDLQFAWETLYPMREYGGKLVVDGLLP